MSKAFDERLVRIEYDQLKKLVGPAPLGFYTVGYFWAWLRRIANQSTGEPE